MKFRLCWTLPVEVNSRRCGCCVCVCARVCIFCECFCNFFVHWFCNYSETVAFPAQVFRIRFVFLVHYFACPLRLFACVFSLLGNIFCLFLDVLSSSRSQSWILHSCLFVLHFVRRYFHVWSQYLYKFVFVRIFSVSAMCRFHSLSQCIKIMSAPLSKVNDTCFNMPIWKEMNSLPL